MSTATNTMTDPTPTPTSIAPSRRFPFTMARLDALPTPASHRQRPTYQDAGCPGLSLRVSAGGAKTFQVYKRLVNHTIRRVVLGTFPQLTVEAARSLARQRLTEIAAGADPNAQKRCARAETTMGDLFVNYMETHAKPHKRTWQDDENCFRRNLQHWSSRKLSEISRAEVQDWHARIGRDRGRITANRAHSLLRKLYNVARNRGYAGENPAVGVQRFQEVSRDRFLGAAELRCFLDALDLEAETDAKDFFRLALLTGARRGNVLAMRWADLDLDAGAWRIPAEASKNGKPLAVVLVSEVAAILAARRPLATDSPWVFPSRAKAGHMIEPTPAWRRIMARAELLRLADLTAAAWGEPGQAAALRRAALAEVELLRSRSLGKRIALASGGPLAEALRLARERAQAAGVELARARMDDVRIHDLRRTNGSWQAANGASLAVIGRSLGHQHTATTAIYARLDLAAVRSSVERAAEAMLAAGVAP